MTKKRLKSSKHQEAWQTSSDFYTQLEHSIGFYQLMQSNVTQSGNTGTTKRYFYHINLVWGCQKFYVSRSGWYQEYKFQNTTVRFFTVEVHTRTDDIHGWWGDISKKKTFIIEYEQLLNKRWRLIKHTEARHGTFLVIANFLNWEPVG